MDSNPGSSSPQPGHFYLTGSKENNFPLPSIYCTWDRRSSHVASSECSTLSDGPKASRSVLLILHKTDTAFTCIRTGEFATQTRRRSTNTFVERVRCTRVDFYHSTKTLVEYDRKGLRVLFDKRVCGGLAGLSEERKFSL